MPEGWKTLVSRGFCKLIPVVFGIASTSLVVKMAENVFRKLFLGHFGQTPLVVPALIGLPKRVEAGSQKLEVSKDRKINGRKMVVGRRNRFRASSGKNHPLAW